MGTCETCGGCRAWLCEGQCDLARCKCTGDFQRRRFWATVLPTLAHNLAIAGALCRAFRLGFDEGWNSTGEGFNGEYARLTPAGYERLATLGTQDDGRPEWRPGCGQPAPKTRAP